MQRQWVELTEWARDQLQVIELELMQTSEKELAVFRSQSAAIKLTLDQCERMVQRLMDQHTA